MSKNVLVGVDGLAREAENLWVGVDGKARRVKSAYVGVNGVARKFWPKIVYVWNRYSINYNIVETFQRKYYGSNYYYSYILRNVSGNLVYRYGTTTQQTAWPFNIVSKSNLYVNNTVYVSTGAFFAVSPVEYEVGENPPLSWYVIRENGTSLVRGRLYYDNPPNSSTNSVYVALGELSEPGLYRINRQASQGSYVGQVTSENPNTYPQNGQSGSYWYVYQGTQG